jgi:hypothetical protein
MTSAYYKEQVLKIYPNAKAYVGNKNSAQVLIFDQDKNPQNGLWTYCPESIWEEGWKYIQEKIMEKLSE